MFRCLINITIPQQYFRVHLFILLSASLSYLFSAHGASTNYQSLIGLSPLISIFYEKYSQYLSIESVNAFTEQPLLIFLECSFIYLTDVFYAQYWTLYQKIYFDHCGYHLLQSLTFRFHSSYFYVSPMEQVSCMKEQGEKQNYTQRGSIFSKQSSLNSWCTADSMQEKKTVLS